MSRNLTTKHLAEKFSTLPAQTKNIHHSSKGTNKLDTKSSNKSTRQPFAPTDTNPKVPTSQNSKNKKDTTAESSPQEKPESSQSSYDGLYKVQMQKSASNKEGSRLLDLCQTDKTKVGDLMRKIAEEKEAKDSLQQELQRRQLDYERTIENMKKSNLDIVQNTKEVHSDLKNSIGLMKSVETLTSKQRQNKLFSNLISAKENRAYNNYNDNPLIANKENIFRQTDNSSKSLARMPGDTSITPTNHSLPPKGINRFSDLELELQLEDRRDKATRPSIGSDKFTTVNTEQDSERISSHSYKLMKFQKLQDDKRTSFDRLSGKPETSDTLQLQTVFSPMRTSFYSSKLSQPEETQEQTTLSRNNPVKAFSSSHNNYLTTSPNQSQNKVERPSPNKSEQYSITITRESESGRENTQNHLVNDKAQFNKVFGSTAPHLPKGMPPKSPTDSYNFFRDSKNSVRRDDNTPSPANKKSTGRYSNGRNSAEPSDRMKEKKENEVNNVIPGVVDLGQMNVNQLIELKNIIDERIEIEELKNKTNKFRRSPMRNLQKADKIIRSSDNQQFSQKINIGEEILNNRSISRSEKFRKTDSMFNRGSSRDRERDSLDLKPSNSLGVPINQDYYIKGKYGSSAGHFYPAGEVESEGVRAGYSDSSRTKQSQGHISGEKDIEDLYNQKLKEFLEVRDTMLKMKETSSLEQSTYSRSTEKSGRENKMSIDINDNGLLSSNILYQFISPVGTKSPLSLAPTLNEKDLMIPAALKIPAPESRALNKPSDATLTRAYKSESYGFRGEEKAAQQKNNFSFAKSGDSSEKGSGLLQFGKKEDLAGTDLMKLVSNMENNKAIRSENRPVLEQTDKLTRKELDRLVNKATKLEDSPNESPIKGDIFHHFAKKNKELGQNIFDPSSPDRPFIFPEDSLSLMETPTLNPLNLGSRSNSSIIETDLSIVAINNKIDEMRDDLYDNKLY